MFLVYHLEFSILDPNLVLCSAFVPTIVLHKYTRHDPRVSSIPVYLYEGNKLLFKFVAITGWQANSVKSVIGTGSAEVWNSMNKNILYLGKFTFTQHLLNYNDKPSMSKADVQAYVNIARTEWVGQAASRAPINDATTPPVKVTRVSDNTIIHYPNFWAVRLGQAELTGKTMTNTTIWRRIESGVPLNGYKYELDE